MLRRSQGHWCRSEEGSPWPDDRHDVLLRKKRQRRGKGAIARINRRGLAKENLPRRSNLPRAVDPFNDACAGEDSGEFVEPQSDVAATFIAPLEEEIAALL